MCRAGRRAKMRKWNYVEAQRVGGAKRKWRWYHNREIRERINIIGIHMYVQGFLGRDMVSEPQWSCAVSLRVPGHLRTAAPLQTNFDVHVQWVRDIQDTLNSWQMLWTNHLCMHNAQTTDLQVSRGSQGTTVLTKLYSKKPNYSFHFLMKKSLWKLICLMA